jgi:hypothetical protein
MNRRSSTPLKLFLLALAVIVALSVSGLALAQSSNLFDLGCWGVLTNGGGLRSSPTVKLQDALGQAAVGTTSSPTVIIRGGYAQNWSAPSATTVQSSQVVTGENLIHMPLLWAFIKNARPC